MRPIGFTQPMNTYSKPNGMKFAEYQGDLDPYTNGWTIVGDTNVGNETSRRILAERVFNSTGKNHSEVDFGYVIKDGILTAYERPLQQAAVSS